MSIIKYGMVGGHMNAFIGEVHRNSIGLNHEIQLVSGAFSKNSELNKQTADTYHIEPQRVYDDYKAMAQEEKGKIDFVAICTPNFTHYEIAKAFLEAGINVVCEKPLCFEVEQALELEALAKQKDLLFGVTYTYTGYTMVKVAKELIAKGEIGNVINVNGEYAQEWLIDEVGKDQSDTANLSVWRKDPKQSGISNCVGDIGTHLENMIHYLTGLEIKRVSAVLDNFGNPLDLNANMLVEYTNGVHGNYWSSQVACGHLNGHKFRIFGDKGALEWDQEHPDQLKFTKKGCPTQILERGTGYLGVDAANCSRIPFGHPEGLHVAFANIYKNYANALRKKKAGLAYDKYDLDFPSVSEGVSGVKFIHAVVESSKNDGAWVEIK